MLRMGRGNKHDAPPPRAANDQAAQAQPAGAQTQPTNAQRTTDAPPAMGARTLADAARQGASSAAAQSPGAFTPQGHGTSQSSQGASSPHAFAPQPGSAQPSAASQPAASQSAVGTHAVGTHSGASQSGSPMRAVTESEALARAVKDGGVGGFVGGTSALSGEVSFRGMMRVDGRLSGHVRSDDGTLIVSAGGRVEAEVSVAVAKINGTVDGDVTATVRVELGRTARVSGNLHTPALVIEEGAIFEGTCRMKSAKPAAKAA